MGNNTDFDLGKKRKRQKAAKVRKVESESVSWQSPAFGG